jgi:hypothetical protein
MAKDLTVFLEENPGSLATMGEALGKAGINIKGTSGQTVEDKGVIHILIEDADKARTALEAAGIDVGVARDVLLVDVQAVPGDLGAKARAIADAGVNIDLIYLTEDHRFVIGVDDLEKAKNVI